jgi:hypothetical protein
MLRMRAMLRLTSDRVDLAARRAWVPNRRQKAGRPFGPSEEPVRILRDLRKLHPRRRVRVPVQRVLRYVHLAPSHTAGAADRVAQWAHTDIRASVADDQKKAEKPKEIGGAEEDRTLDLRIASAH